MFAKLLSGAISGFEPIVIEVEVDVAGGLPIFTVVGLPDAAVNEARERVRSAIKNAGFEIPVRRLTVNLAPADIKKEGTGLDVPLAIGILAATGFIPMNRIEKMMFIGEMSLDGHLRHTRGILPLALLAKEKKLSGIVVPQTNVSEAQVVPDLPVYGFETLAELVNSLKYSNDLPVSKRNNEEVNLVSPAFHHADLSDVKGQSVARRALEIAASGGHNLLFIGPPGAGKTLLARSLPTILPPLSFEEAIEVTKIYSVKGLLPAGCGLLSSRPFRDPHHTISDVALIGGGRIPSPGEVSLSHNGILFLDELTEFKKSVLDVLREPLTEGHVSISRASQATSFPARFQLLGAMNPCSCGYLGDPIKTCTCTPKQIRNHKMRLSGPLLDRIDIQIWVPRLNPKELVNDATGEPSEPVLKRVIATRELQRERYSHSKTRLNAHLSPKLLKKYCVLKSESSDLLLAAAQKFGLSARAFDKIIRVARTIADLDSSPSIEVRHLSEAIQYRTFDFTELN